MFSKKFLAMKRLLAVELGCGIDTRGISEFRFRDTRYWPGDDLQNRNYRRIWFNQHKPAPGEMSEGPTHRLDDTMYNPRRWREREYQSTWRESSMLEDELQLEDEAETAKPRYQKPVAKSHGTTSRRNFDAKRRLQRVAIPAGEFFSRFISDQQKRKMRHYEAGVVAERLSNEEFQLD
ncbi:uncharacterized protein LOC110177953 [Drosophila serrata]|uniref:uncharacterized protein LOC110177953 n=1 Tax=Drosophila serrata TaxID=7274 RepID=UPI000A1CFDD0|nr:uncharacterized protein LOC110177953 [Drosophila serrata]